MDEWHQRMAHDARLKELTEFRYDYQRAWGVLSADELAMFARTEHRLLMERNPVAFMERVHDAVFNRKIMEENKAQYSKDLERMLKRVEAAESRVPVLENEVAVMKAGLMREKTQTTIQTQRVDALEQELAICRYQLKLVNMQWVESGKQVSMLEQSMASLARENERIRSKQ